MAVKNKFIHFNTRSGFNSQVPNPGLNSENGNEFYNYIVFIKESKEIYTHGQFYDCSKYDDTEILQLVNSISDRFDTFESNLNDLTSEVEDNELVAAKALTDLNNKIESVINGANSDSGIINPQMIYPQAEENTYVYRIPSGVFCELFFNPNEANASGIQYIVVVFDNPPEVSVNEDGTYSGDTSYAKYHFVVTNYGCPIGLYIENVSETCLLTNGGVSIDSSEFIFEMDALANIIAIGGERLGYIYGASAAYAHL